MSAVRTAFGALVLAALAGCTVGPDFHTPAPPADTAYTAEPAGNAPGPRVTEGEGPAAGWWSAFGSPALDTLVDRALAHNHSLAASDATLIAARADMRAIAGRRLPQIDANARVEQQEVNLAAFGFSGLGGLNLANPEFHLYSVGGGISFDPDVFGGLRRAVEQSAADAEAEQHRAEAAHLALAGQVVNTVLEIAAIRTQIATVTALLDDDQRNLDLTSRRRELGEGTLTEQLNVESQQAADRAALPTLQQQLAEARHLLAVLVGAAPAELGPTDFDLDAFALPGDVPVALPSALVHRRPDILAAEAQLHAATAAIGVAQARLYPALTLGATDEQGGPNLTHLLNAGFRSYDLFAGVSAPIFHGGTLRAQRNAALARARAADATYQQTILVAFGQVADLLTGMDNDARALALQQASLAVAAHSLQLSRRSYQVGNSGLLQVLDSERLYQRAAEDLTTARARQFVDVARLYVATAGGWTSPPAPAPAAR